MVGGWHVVIHAGTTPESGLVVRARTRRVDGRGVLLAALATAVATATGGSASAQAPPPATSAEAPKPPLPSLGPLTSEEGAPLQRLGFTPSMEGTDVTPPGRISANLWVGYGNVWEQDSSAVANVFLDMERVITAATVRFGVVNGLEMGVRATVERTGGGFMDGVVTGLHSLVGAGDRNRFGYPDDDDGQSLRDGDGTLLVDIPRRTGPALEDVRLFAKWGAWTSADGRRALSVKGAVRVPVAGNTLGSERADAAVMVMGRAGWRGFHFHGLAGGSSVRRSPELAEVLTHRQFFFMAGAERPLNPNLSLALQFTGSTQLLRRFGDHDVDGMPTNTVFGVVGRTAGGWRWEVAMQEDTPPRGPSTDFMLQFGLGRSW